MHRPSLAMGSALLGLAVAFGAFGAHALKARLEPGALAQWSTAVDYQFVHGTGILFLALAGDRLPGRVSRACLIAFATGVLLFSGSLYLLATMELHGLAGLVPVLGPATPVGGLCFMAGWAILLITALRRADGC